MNHKLVTDKQLQYIFNVVIIPRIEYRSQLTFISEDKCRSLTVPYRTLFKHKLNIGKCAPNALIQTRLLYNFRNLYDVKLQAIFSNLTIQLNNSGLLWRTMRIQVYQLQSDLFLHKCPLEYWLFDWSQPFHNSFNALLSVLPSLHLSFSLDHSWMNDIQGGLFPISSVLSSAQYIKAVPSRQNLMFIDQLISQNGLYMIKWPNQHMSNPKLNNSIPKWFKQLESIITHDFTKSRKLISCWIIPSQPPIFNNSIFFNNVSVPFGSWCFHWSSTHNQLIVGKVLKYLNDNILIEYWSFFPLSMHVSPSSQPFLVSRYLGCLINDHCISHSAYFPQHIRSPCVISCKQDVLLKLPSFTQQGPNLKITASSFQLFDLSKYHALFNLLSSKRLEPVLSTPAVPASFTSHPIFQFIHSNLCHD